MNEISQKIKRIRGKLSLAEFEQKAGIHQSLLSMYESGKRKPSLDSLIKLADYGGVSIDYLLDRDESSLLPEEQEIIWQLRKLPPNAKYHICGLLEELSKHIKDI